MMIVILTVSIVPAAIIIVRAFCFTLYKILTVVALVFGDDRLFWLSFRIKCGCSN